MTILRACVKCGRPGPESYCEEHKPKPWATSTRRERMGISGGAWETVRKRVLARDQGCCYLCDQFGADEVDHLIEVAAGGTSRTDNLASCHAECHRRKHRDPEWAAERVAMALRVLRGVGMELGFPRVPGTARGAACARKHSPLGGRSEP